MSLDGERCRLMLTKDLQSEGVILSLDMRENDRSLAGGRREE